MNKISEKAVKRIKLIGIMFLLSILACIPYLKGGTIFAHDLQYHLHRIISTAEELSYGEFPVFIHSNLFEGFGYGNPLFYPELFLYPAILLVKMGVGILFSYKILIFIVTFATFIITFYSANIINKNSKISMLTSMLYTFSMYRLVDVFVRGALGEILAFTFFPLVIAGFYDVYFGENKRWYLICFGFFGIMNSHVISTAIVVITLILLCIINIYKLKDKARLKNIILAAIVSILLVCSFVFPYIEQSLSQEFKFNVSRYSGEFMKLHSTKISEIFSNEFKSKEVTKSVGILLIVLPILIFFIKNKKMFFVELYVLGVLVTFMSSEIFPWEKMEIISIIQFPFRLNLISTMFFSLVAGYASYEVFENKGDMYKIIFLLILFVTIGYIAKVDTNPNLINYEILMGGKKEALEEYKPVGFNNNEKQVCGNNIIMLHTKNGNKIEFEYNEEAGDKVSVPLTFYKGYIAYDENGNKINVSKNEENANIILDISDNISGKITVEYRMTSMQKIGYIISIMTLIILTNYVIYNFKKVR